MHELKGFRPEGEDFVAVINHPKGRRFTAQPGGSITVEQGTQRVVDIQEAERLAEKNDFYRAIRDKLVSLKSFVNELIENGPKTLKDTFTLSVFGASAPHQPSVGLTVGSPALRNDL